VPQTEAKTQRTWPTQIPPLPQDSRQPNIGGLWSPSRTPDCYGLGCLARASVVRCDFFGLPFDLNRIRLNCAARAQSIGKRDDPEKVLSDRGEKLGQFGSVQAIGTYSGYCWRTVGHLFRFQISGRPGRAVGRRFLTTGARMPSMYPRKHHPNPDHIVDAVGTTQVLHDLGLHY
jgi:hypothetical protein